MARAAPVNNSAAGQPMDATALRPWKGDQQMDQKLLLAYLRYVAAKLERDARVLTHSVNNQQRNRTGKDLHAIAAELRTLTSAPPSA